MPLPIIIIFERHWDTAPKKLLKKLLIKLSQEGYNSFCCESPNDLNENKIIDRINYTVEFDQNLYNQAKEYLQKRSVQLNCELSDLPYDDLVKLIHIYVSSQTYAEVAEKIKTLPAFILMKETMQNALRLNFFLEGVDIDSREFDPMYYAGLSERAKDLRKNMDYRDATISQNILKLYEKREGVIFVCGFLHAPALMSFFKNKIMEDQVLFYFPRSTSQFDNDGTDVKLLNSVSTEENRFVLYNDEDIESLSNKILIDIQRTNTRYIKEVVDDCSHVKALSKACHPNFKGFQRGGYYIDAALAVDGSVDEETINKKLARFNIHSHYRFFNEKKYLVVPNVNVKDVADNIFKMK